MGHPSEHMVTNLGPVPEGVAFLDAVFASAEQRKHRINPRHESRRLTICEISREVWRLADTLPEPARGQFQELAAAAFDMGKRLHHRVVELRDGC